MIVYLKVICLCFLISLVVLGNVVKSWIVWDFDDIKLNEVVEEFSKYMKYFVKDVNDYNVFMVSGVKIYIFCN